MKHLIAVPQLTNSWVIFKNVCVHVCEVTVTFGPEIFPSGAPVILGS